jgi:hypothetical protein
MRDITLFAGRLAGRCRGVRSIWLMGARADALAGSGSSMQWDLVAFADALSLQQLRRSPELHRADVQLRVVTDGDRFEMAWGSLQDFGSLLRLAWRQASDGEAYYNEARWAGPVHDGNVEHARLKAVRLFQAMEAAPQEPR